MISQIPLIFHAVEQSTGITQKEIQGRSRKRGITLARHEVMYELRKRTSQRYSRIGRIVKRDHSTVISGIKAHCKRNGLEVPQ